ncbi:MAG: lipid-binding SYLF domain-containing protein [Planctomycetota bacterium]|jgi:lipid-binding SYLF domain-containing protein
MKLLWVLPLAMLAACQTAEGDTAAEKRASIRTMRDQTLADLYKEEPSAKGAIENAPGYAVFSNFGMKIFVFGSGNGYGMLVNKKAAKDVFMRMAEVNVGVGLGGKKFRAVFVFIDEATMNQFAESGWDFGADAGAGAKKGDEGGEASAGASVQGMKIYLLTDTGVEVQATVGGTKYYKDDELN